LQRSFSIDVLKVFAAQLIVWHHLSAYGLVADTLRLAWPNLITFLYEYSRMAVQVFLVIAGYLMAQSLNQRAVGPLGSSLLKRYWRLTPPLLAALLWVSATVALARPFVQGDWLPLAPQLLQVAAHALMLQGLLDVPALSSGVWYVAIDFQLYALMTVLTVAVTRITEAHRQLSAQALSLCVLLLCCAAFYFFNLNKAWDNWGVYFFGSYGLGILAAWSKRSRFDHLVFVLALGLALLSQLIAFRGRLSVAMLTALLLSFACESTRPWGVWRNRIHRLANSSYAQFLTHFGVIVLFNTLWAIERLSHPALALCFALLAWLCSIAIGMLFHERVETALSHWRPQPTRLIFWRVSN